MKRFITALLAAAVAGALFVASPLVAAPKGTNFNNSSDTYSTDDGCGEGDARELFVHAPAKLWPPNHKYFPDVNVTATSDDPNETITLTTTGWHNQYVEGDNGLEEQNGSGNTADDIRVNPEEETLTPSAGTSEEGYPTVIAMESGSSEVITNWLVRAERSGRDKAGRVYTLRGDATFSGDNASCSVEVQMVVPHDMRPINR